MAAPGSAFPAFLKLEYQDDGTAQAGFAQAVEAIAEKGRQGIRRFSVDANQALSEIGAGNTLERALSLPRTAIGSLDVGVAALRRTALEADDASAKARELAVAMELLQRESADYSAAAGREVAAMNALAREREEAAVAARAQLSSAQQLQTVLDREAGAVGRSVAATRIAGAANDNMRFGLMDLGRQLNDVSTMWALGARPMQIFASQSGHIIQSIQLMTGGTSRLAGFLGGPWGIALTTATLALTPLIGKLFESSDAMDDAGAAADRLADSLTNLANLKFDSGDLTEVTKKMLALQAESAALERRAVQSGADRGAGGLYYRQQAQEKAREAEALRRQLEAAVDPANPARVISTRNQAIYDARPDRSSRSDTSASATERQTAATEAAIRALRQEIAAIGQTQGQLRQLEIERLKAAATTDTQRAALEQLNQQREEALSTQARQEALSLDAKAVAALDQRISAIRDETTLLALVGPARDKAALALEHEAFLAQAAADGILDAESAWLRYFEARNSQIDTQSALERDQQAAELLRQELDHLIGSVSRLGGVGGAVGGLLGLASGNIGSIGGPLGALLNMAIGTTTDTDGKLVARRIGDELRGIFAANGEFSKAMTDVLKGASIGVSAGALISTSGSSQLGSAIGGSLGSELGEKFLGKGLETIAKGLGSVAGPLGAIAGGLLGGVVGGLFSSAKYGTASLSGADSLSAVGKGAGRTAGATSLGGSVQQALANIADELDATVGAFRVSIGTYKDSLRVSTTGRTGKLKVKYGDVQDFGQDEGAAIAYAVMDAIKDGAIKGLRAGTQKLLQGSSDVEKAVQDALTFEGVFGRLAALKDPTGAALDDLDDEFGKLKSLFTKAGATQGEWLQLEELYWLERDELLKDAMERELGSLRGFLDELTFGNSALSLRDRKSSALASFNPLADRVAAGDATAYDDFVDAARALLDIERQMSGSQNGYFDLLNRVTGLTQGALDGGAGAAFADSDSPFGPRGGVNDGAGVISSVDRLRDEISSGTNSQLAAVNSQLAAANQNLGTIAGLLRSGSSTLNYGTVDRGW